MARLVDGSARWVAVAALVLMSACDAFKEDRLGDGPMSDAGNGGTGGGGTGGGGSGTGGMVGDGGAVDGGGMCAMQDEACNLADDDCDGTVDEDTVAACEAIVKHAETECVVSRGRARCLKIACLDGFADRDGDPTNGCETELADSDGGADLDAGS